MAISERIREIKTGFTSSFWVANSLELFERLAFYGQQAVLAIYLFENLKLTEVETGSLIGIFGGVIYFLPILAGALSDRFGFKKSLTFAFSGLAIGYFFLGQTSSQWFQTTFHSAPLYWIIFFILMLTAMGGSFIKPSVVGTVAKTSKEKTKSLGYSIYYTIVNIGGALGPIIAFFVRENIGIQNVFNVSAISCTLMVIATLLFYKEPKAHEETEVRTVGRALANMFLVLKNLKFVLFLIIFSGFWMMFFELYIALPLYLRSYVDPNAPVDLLLSIGALTIIFFQVMVSFITRKIAPLHAMVLGFIISSFSMLLIASVAHLYIVVVALVVWAIGEMTQAPRYYEYISTLAPRGQEGLYMGYAFLPISIGAIVAGPLGGFLVQYFGKEIQQPRLMWLVIASIGLIAALLLYVYNKIFVGQKNVEHEYAASE